MYLPEKIVVGHHALQWFSDEINVNGMGTETSHEIKINKCKMPVVDGRFLLFPETDVSGKVDRILK